MKKVSTLLAFTLFLVLSCSDKTTIYENPNSNINLEDNQDFLNESINEDNAGALDIKSITSISGKTGKSEDESTSNYPLSLIAQVTPPSFSGGQNLTATHVNVVDDIAYVSYNTVNEDYVGAIDVIDVSNPYSPRITSRLFYTNADINSLAYHNGFIYIVGGVDAETSVRATTNSFIAKIPAVNGRIDIESGIIYGFQEGHSSNDIAISNEKIYVTSGKDGSLAVYDINNLESIVELPFADLRSVSLQDNKIAILDASSGVSILDTNLSLLKDISITSDFGNTSKRTIAFSQDRIIVSEGSKGAGVYNSVTGSFLEYIPILISSEDSNSAENVTNAVAVNEGVILMANGAAGLSLSEETSETTNPVGVLDLEGSINFVASKGDYIFAASGNAGLQIIKMNKPSTSLSSKCNGLDTYKGSSNVVVNAGEVLAFSDSKGLNSLTINGELLLCGSYTVKDQVILNSDSVFEMKGSLLVGKNRSRKSITVNSNATFRVEGNLTIYGDLILEKGAKLEFVGANSIVYVKGEVTKADTATISGDFNDILSKF